MVRSVEPNDIYPHYHHAITKARGLRRLILSVFPLHLLVQVKRELRLFRLLPRRRGIERAFRDASGLLVNLGAGNQGREGWINLDSEPLPGINCLYDCRKRLPFSDSSVAAIFCEHFFEHLDYTEEVPLFLAECRRVLMDGAPIRIVVPDAGEYLRSYCEEGWDAIGARRPLDGERRDEFGAPYRTKMELVNAVFRQGQDHKFAYDFETLEYQLSKNHFRDVRRQEYGRSMMEGLALDQKRRASESLYVEARK